MNNTIAKTLTEWNNTTEERSKLQHSYIVLTLASVVVAGLIGLIDYDLGQRILVFALICAGVFVANALTWALLSGLVLVKLTSQPIGKPSVRAAKATTKNKKS